MNDGWIAAIRTTLRILTFRADRGEIEAFNWRHLVLGLGVIWLSAVGSGWHDTELAKRLGVLSLIQVLFLSYFLWITARPFISENSSYWRLLTFICIMSLPGCIYIWPSGKFSMANPISDTVIAAAVFFEVWQCALYAWYLARIENLSGARLVVLWLMILAPLMYTYIDFGDIAGIIVMASTGKMDKVAILKLDTRLAPIGYLFFRALMAQYLWNVGQVAVPASQRKAVWAPLLPVAYAAGFGVIAAIMEAMGYINLHGTFFVLKLIFNFFLDAVILLPLCHRVPGFSDERIRWQVKDQKEA